MLSNILLSSYAEAQEAKLVKQAEWGSGVYDHMVEINGHYYIKTSSGQVDVINPELTGEASLVGQIKFGLESDIHAISKFKDFLVVVISNKINVYSISDITNITKVYSVSVIGDWDGTAVYQGDYLYYVDGDSKIFVIEEKEGGFSLASVIQSQKSNHDEELYVLGRNLFIEDSTLYYLYRLQEGGILSTKIESYQLDDLTLIDSGELEDIGVAGRGVYLGHGRFVISNYQQLYLIKLIDGQINILNDFDGVQYNKSFNLTVKDNIVKAIADSVLYTFQISDTNAISISSTESLTDYFHYNSYMRYVNWRDDKLIGVNSKSGAFEIKLINDAIDSVAFSYNQSGYMGKAVIENNLIYLPRESRIDVVNIANIDNLTWQNSIPEYAHDIERMAGSLIFSNYQRISNQTITSDSVIQLNSEVAINSKVSPLLYKDSHIYHVNFDDEYSVMRHSVNSPYSLYEAPKNVGISNLTNACPQKLGFLTGRLIATDPCGFNKIRLFTDYDTDDFAYSRSIEHGFSYYQLVIGSEYLYLISPQGIKIVELTEAEELVEVSSVDITFSTFSGISAEILEGYLFVSDGFYFYLFDISEPNLPTLVSKAETDDFEWREANIQIEGGYILVTTKGQGQVKFFQLNKAPIVNVVTLEINEDESSAPLIIFTDPELDSLEISIITDVNHGDVAIDGEEIVYTPNENFSGEDAILLKAEDIHGNFIEHELLVTVNAVNDAPIILTSVLSTNEDTVLAAELTFQDIENDDVEFHLLTDPTNGLASISLQGVLTYQPNDHFFGEDSLVVSITDENSGVSEKEIAITIASVNDKPELVGMTFNVDEDSLLSDQLTATDIDSEVLTFSVITAPESGALNLQDSGHFTYQPNADYDQQDSFEVAVTDEQGAVSQAQFIIEVNSVNDAPDFEDNNFFINEDTALTQALLFSDVDSGVHTAEMISPAINGAVELNNSAVFTYIPNNNFSGIEQFSVRITDEHGASVEGVVKVTIAAVNDAPVFTTTVFSVDEDNILTSELKASDIEGQTLTFELISNADLQGSVNVESDGQFTFKPVINFNGETTFTVKVTDSEANSSTEIMTMIVNAVEDVPEPENTALSLLFNGNVSQNLPTTDVDGQLLSYRIVTDVKNGLLTLSEAGQYKYSPNSGFSGSDSFTYEVSDINNNVGQATVSFTVQSAVAPKKSESSSGGSFGYFMLLSLVVSFCFRARRVGKFSY